MRIARASNANSLSSSAQDVLLCLPGIPERRAPSELLLSVRAHARIAEANNCSCILASQRQQGNPNCYCMQHRCAGVLPVRGMAHLERIRNARVGSPPGVHAFNTRALRRPEPAAALALQRCQHDTPLARLHDVLLQPGAFDSLRHQTLGLISCARQPICCGAAWRLKLRYMLNADTCAAQGSVHTIWRNLHMATSYINMAKGCPLRPFHLAQFGRGALAKRGRSDLIHSARAREIRSVSLRDRQALPLSSSRGQRGAISNVLRMRE